MLLLLARLAWSQPLPTPLYSPSPAATSQPASLTPTPTVPVAAELASPRATVNSFLQAMASGTGRWNGYREARGHLDLTDIPSLVRHEKGVELSRQLFEVLQAAQLDWEQIPDRSEGDQLTIYRQPSGDEISVSRSAIGEWRFSCSTIQAIPRMYAVLTKKGKIDQWDVPDWLDFEFLCLSGVQWLLLGLVPLLAWAFASATVLTLRKSLHHKMHVNVDQLKFLKPLRWTLVSLLSWLCWSAISLPQGLLLPLLAILKLLATYATVASAFGLCDLAAQYLSSVAAQTQSTRDDMLVPLLKRAAKVVIVLLGLLVIAQNLEIEVWSLFAGFSIVGAMVALAGQETVKNFFGSCTILLDQPFAVGDWITLEGGTEGTVEEVGFRSTRIRTFYDSLVTVPNSRFITATVDNYGARRSRRYTTRVNLGLETPLEQVEAFCEGVRELIRRQPMTTKSNFQVWVNDVSAYSLQVLIYVFWQCPDWTTELQERHRLLTDMQRLVQSMELRFAYPTQTLHVDASSQTGVPGEPAQGSPNDG